MNSNTAQISASESTSSKAGIAALESSGSSRLAAELRDLEELRVGVMPGVPRGIVRRRWIGAVRKRVAPVLLTLEIGAMTRRTVSRVEAGARLQEARGASARSLTVPLTEAEPNRSAEQHGSRRSERDADGAGPSGSRSGRAARRLGSCSARPAGLRRSPFPPRHASSYGPGVASVGARKTASVAIPPAHALTRSRPGSPVIGSGSTRS